MLIARNNFLLVAIMLVSSLAYAQNLENSVVHLVNITYDIQPDSSVGQTTIFVFGALLNTTGVNYSISQSAKDILVSDGRQQLDYRLENGRIQIFLKEATETLTISYVIDNAVFKSDSISHFFSEFVFGREIWRVTAYVKLPEDYVIYNNEYSPGADIISDGERIVLLWEKPRVTNPVFSVKFVPRQNDDPWLTLALLLTGVILFLFFYFRQRTKEEFIKGFREDEKKTIEYLEQKKTALQSDLQEEFKFSRAKSTRIVARLEEKGLVRKKKYGRTNKLYWLK